MKYPKVILLLIALVINQKTALFCANTEEGNIIIGSPFIFPPGFKPLTSSASTIPWFFKLEKIKNDLQADAERKAHDAFCILRLNVTQNDIHSAKQNFPRYAYILKPQDLTHILRLAITTKLTDFIIELLYNYRLPLLIVKQINHTLFLVTLKVESDIKEPLLIVTNEEIARYFSKNFISDDKKTIFYQTIQSATDQERAKAWKESGIGFIERPR